MPISTNTMCLLTNDIPSAIPDQVHSRHSSLLGIPRHITTYQTQQRNKRRRTSLRQVISRQATRVVRQRQCDDQNHANYSGAESEHGDEDPVPVFVAGPAAGDEEDDFDGAAGRAVEEGFFWRVAETYD
jgi:hypothetical protein